MSDWTVVVGPEDITLHIQGAVAKSSRVPGVYVTLRFGGGFETTMHSEMARELRDWLVAHVPDSDAF
jgi:hypothetical protein